MRLKYNAQISGTGRANRGAGRAKRGAGGAKRGAGGAKCGPGGSNMEGRGRKVMKIPSIVLYKISPNFAWKKVKRAKMGQGHWLSLETGRISPQDCWHFQVEGFSGNIPHMFLISLHSHSQALAFHACFSRPWHSRHIYQRWAKNRTIIGCCSGIPPSFPGCGFPSMLPMPSDTF